MNGRNIWPLHFGNACFKALNSNQSEQTRYNLHTLTPSCNAHALLMAELPVFLISVVTGHSSNGFSPSQDNLDL